MELWKKLYNTVWLAFFCCVLIPRWMGLYIGLPVHVVLGLLMLFLTQSNAKRLRALPVPDRLKRISKATAGIAMFQLVAGIAMGGARHLAPNVPYLYATLTGIHVVCALTILAQASSTATGYDMWEEKETGPTSEETKPKG